MEDRTTSFKFDAELMGRASVKAEDHDKILGALSRAASVFDGAPSYFRAMVPCSLRERDDVSEDFGGSLEFGKVVGTLPLPAFCPAKPIRAERLKFPSAPSFSLVGYLDEPTLQRFLRSLDFATLPSQATEPPPKVRILADREQSIALFSALAQSGRLLPVTVHPERLPFAGGLFAVVKDLHRDRLVLDARPGNTLESAPNFWTWSLGCAAALLPYKDYFYLFRISQQRLESNLLTGALSPEECRAVFGHECAAHQDNQGRVRVALSTLAMGDSSACRTRIAYCCAPAGPTSRCWRCPLGLRPCRVLCSRHFGQPC